MSAIASRQPRRRLRRAVVVLGLVAALATACQMLRDASDPLLPKAAGALRVGSWNVHYILLNEAEGAWSVDDWERRRRPLDLAFKALEADVVAFQEMESFAGGNVSGVNLALDWLLERNPGYASTATGDPQRFPATQPILYRHSRLEALEQGWFFFSETPDVLYSRTFDGSYPAFASWARFRDRDDGRRFRVVNVHFDYASSENRRGSTALVVQHMEAAVAAGETVMLVGDLNARIGSEITDTLATAGLSFVPVSGSTYHFNHGIDLFGAIDHIALGPGARAVSPAMVLRRRFAGEWPSDHYPLVVDVVIDGSPDLRPRATAASSGRPG